MAKKKNAAAMELGSRGGKARVRNLTADELQENNLKAINARWAAYYKLHPDKLKAKLAREKKAKKKGGPKHDH